MQINRLHSWDLGPQEAIHIQQQLCKRIQLTPLPPDSRLVAGADVSYNTRSDQFYAGVVVLQLPRFALIEQAVAMGRSPFPYIPGLLSFREAPILLQAFQQLHVQPDVILFDGQGIAHPRKLGIAAHLGLWLDCPSIGCAKSRLIGIFHKHQLAETAGSFIPLYSKEGSVIGSVVRTKHRIKPVFVSPGHQADVSTSCELVLKCCAGYRLPEPTRQAHLLANTIRKES